ncbi:MAG: FKBP-type peptidyl-prolyl cis-trans isomerase [Bacteroidota bacterium]
MYKSSMFLLALIVSLFIWTGCGENGGKGGSMSLENTVDSASYAIGMEMSRNFGNIGVTLNSDELKRGFDELLAESAYMAGPDALQFINAFGIQVQIAMQRGERTVNLDSINVSNDSLSYAIGVDLADRVKNIDLTMNSDAVKAGYDDRLADTPKLDSASVVQQLNSLQTRMQQRMEQLRAEQGLKNKAEGMAFLKENGTQEGVQTTASGLQYKVERAGTGNSPSADDVVVVHYEGRLLDGTKFDSSYERGTPAEFPVGGVIRGWTEALQLMKTGAKWQLYIPSDLAYGEMGSGNNIGPSALLIFDVELLDIKEKE